MVILHEGGSDTGRGELAGLIGLHKEATLLSIRLNFWPNREFAGKLRA